MKILDVLYNFYGDFDFIEEKYNEKYEGILINIKEEQGYKRCRLAKRTPKKEGYFTVFWKKDQNNKNIPYTNEDLGNELIIVIIDNDKRGLFIIPNEVAIRKNILSTKDSNGKMSMRFYPPWCSNLNTTARATQKRQLQYFREIEI
ncbi:MepB family protein [Streptococcus oralis]|uniref:MepB family protein n=1 Tax=Streptococcus oralis TaxID=1303 RepID=UPI002285148D|nr:MepB family protein [Streptococcus oralis]MCY7092951.1 MepB family protein [Streptococcus oralis]